MSSSAQFLSSHWRTWLAWRPLLSVETLAALAGAVLMLFYNNLFWQTWQHALLDGPGSSWWLTAVCAVLLWALHTTFLLLLLARWNARWVLGLVFVVSAFATYYMDTYQVFIDPPMVRNVVHTEPKEAAELLTLGLLWRLCWQAGLPLLLLWRVRLQPRRFSAALGRRALAIAALMALVVGLGLLSFQPMSLLMRGHKEMRYLITPGNWIVSLFSVLHENSQISQGPH
ncbi:MAG: DUF1705 domain-containing protein, partial [Xanthomonadales bacterium]|nr:DUF1705 domain-containing protein [Xanthomonadales bacterium]